MTLRLAQVIAGGANGGAENFFVRLNLALHGETDIEQQAFLRHHPQRQQALLEGGLRCQNFRFGGPLHWLDRLHYRRALKQFTPDVVMTWMNRASQLTPAGNYQLVARLGHYYNLKYYRHCNHWIGISRGICDHLVAGGMPAQRVHYIPNFASEAPVPAVERSAFSTPPKVPLLLAAGRLHENKGFDVLIRALVEIPEAVLWLAGDGPEEAALKALAVDLGVSERIRFIGWWPDIASLLQSADLFVCPSRHEGLGSVVLEAWLNRCPIVATASQGPGELIEDGITGLLTPVDQVQPLAGAIRQLIDQPPLRQALADTAWQHYQSHFSQQVITRQYQELLNGLAGTVNP
ncbi:MAG: glycosyltransferase [Halomonadaceae bacterium]|nr:MAG: glycosyltransferase [Halomonadaceae bacterium]